MSPTVVRRHTPAFAAVMPEIIAGYRAELDRAIPDDPFTAAILAAFGARSFAREYAALTPAELVEIARLPDVAVPLSGFGSAGDVLAAASQIVGASAGTPAQIGAQLTTRLAQLQQERLVLTSPSGMVWLSTARATPLALYLVWLVKAGRLDSLRTHAAELIALSQEISRLLPALVATARRRRRARWLLTAAAFIAAAALFWWVMDVGLFASS